MCHESVLLQLTPSRVSVFKMSTVNTWVAGGLAATPNSGLIPIVLVCMVFMHQYMGVTVGRARKRLNVPYPTLYAVPGKVVLCLSLSCLVRCLRGAARPPQRAS